MAVLSPAMMIFLTSSISTHITALTYSGSSCSLAVVRACWRRWLHWWPLSRARAARVPWPCSRRRTTVASGSWSWAWVSRWSSSPRTIWGCYWSVPGLPRDMTANPALAARSPLRRSRASIYHQLSKVLCGRLTSGAGCTTCPSSPTTCDTACSVSRAARTSSGRSATRWNCKRPCPRSSSRTTSTRSCSLHQHIIFCGNKDNIQAKATFLSSMTSSAVLLMIRFGGNFGQYLLNLLHFNYNSSNTRGYLVIQRSKITISSFDIPCAQLCFYS